ncbi:MAG: aspartyl protease family protein, partial [candidate division Zixibacteria bacterium]|nr:aspartyl protease family protein [candidate division Zixibacteria bacterium]
SMNDDSVITYINTSSFIIEKEISFEAGKETHTLFSDHREVNGVLRAFRQDITELPTGQEMSVRVIKYESDITIDPLLFEPPGGDIRDFRFTDGRSSENVPFEFILDHLFVRVNCGGKERLWILDTGAEITCIDSTFASELGLEQSGDMKVQGTGNTTSLTFVRLPSFSVKGIEFDEQTIACLDMKNLIMDKAGLDAVGVLGYDFLSRFVVKIDYGKRLLSFYEPEAFTYTGGGRTLAAPLKGNSIAVPATVDGVHSGKWCLDIGNGDCTFHFPYAERHRFHQRDGIDVVNTGAGGEYRTREMEFDSFELAGYVIDKPVIGVPVDVRGGTMGETEFIGNLGNSILRHFTLYLDYPNQQVIVEKGDDFDKVFPTSKGGCQIYYNADRQLEVGYVSDNTPAAEAGLRKGDILIAINKIAVEHFNGILAIRDLFLTEAGTKYELAVVRDGRQRNVTLKLRDLYRK